MNEKTIIPLLAGLLAGILASAAALFVLFGGGAGLKAALKYASVLHVVRQEFVADYDMEQVSDYAMSGAIEGLGDRWSYYMDTEDYASYIDYAANRYQGIGVTVSRDEESGGFLVNAITKDGPAMRAGIVPGDIILAVDGQDVTEGELADLKALIQADYGKEALITVRHVDGTAEEYPVSCETIYSSPVESELLEDGRTGYIVIENFRDGSARNAIEAVSDLVGQGAEQLVFDVRNDPGGQLTELVELLDYLLPEGELIIRSDKAGHELIDSSDASCVELPMAVIVNGDSYSAAEFFAAALREYGWAVVVGEPTTGKSRSQVTVELSDGSAVHLSKYRYLTPGRVDLNETGGITPDVEVPLTDEQRAAFDTGWLEPSGDPQVQAAVEALSAGTEPAKIDGQSS